MKKSFIIINTFLVVFSLLLIGCQPTSPAPVGKETASLKVVAAESFLADVAQNVAGDRAKVDSLIPIGMDPHAFEPVPQDVAKIVNSSVVIINGKGIEWWLNKILTSSGGDHLVITACEGLANREPREGEKAEGEAEEEPDHDEGDPHYWLDPISMIHYVENIRDGLIKVDPDGKDVYTKNAEIYIEKLKNLDADIRKQVETIPEDKRLIVTNHESFGYFADRYGFKIIGTIVPSVSTGATPSAQQVAKLVDHIRSTGASAIFLETGTNPALAEQISKETGVKVVTDLYTHSITAADGKAPTYIDMMKYNVKIIVDTLK